MLALHAVLEAAPPVGVVDLVPAARTLLVTVDRRVTTVEDVATVSPVRAGPATGGVRDTGRGSRCVTTGEDLAEVAALTGLSEPGVVEAHTGQLWTVGFAGFAPGFGYLTATDERLHVPRRGTPRTAVPAGAVGLAGEFSGVYPRESPGGWQLVGSTRTAMWDLRRDPPALLRPGGTGSTSRSAPAAMGRTATATPSRGCSQPRP